MLLRDGHSSRSSVRPSSPLERPPGVAAEDGSRDTRHPQDLHRSEGALARVNALAESLPNRSILIHALPLQEARSSSEIENIVTTGDELYRALASGASADAAAKEVLRYREALWEGMEGLDRRPNLDVRLFERICSRIRGVDVRVRQGRVAIGNPAHGRVILHASRWRRARQAARQSGTFSRRAGGRSRSAHQDGRHALPVRGHSPVH